MSRNAKSAFGLTRQAELERSLASISSNKMNGINPVLLRPPLTKKENAKTVMFDTADSITFAWLWYLLRMFVAPVIAVIGAVYVLAGGVYLYNEGDFISTASDPGAYMVSGYRLHWWAWHSLRMGFSMIGSADFLVVVMLVLRIVYLVYIAWAKGTPITQIQLPVHLVKFDAESRASDVIHSLILATFSFVAATHADHAVRCIERSDSIVHPGGHFSHIAEERRAMQIWLSYGRYMIDIDGNTNGFTYGALLHNVSLLLFGFASAYIIWCWMAGSKPLYLFPMCRRIADELKEPDEETQTKTIQTQAKKTQSTDDEGVGVKCEDIPCVQPCVGRRIIGCADANTTGMCYQTGNVANWLGSVWNHVHIFQFFIAAAFWIMSQNLNHGSMRAEFAHSQFFAVRESVLSDEPIETLLAPAGYNYRRVNQSGMNQVPLWSRGDSQLNPATQYNNSELNPDSDLDFLYSSPTPAMLACGSHWDNVLDVIASPNGGECGNALPAPLGQYPLNTAPGAYGNLAGNTVDAYFKAQMDRPEDALSKTRYTRLMSSATLAYTKGALANDDDEGSIWSPICWVPIEVTRLGSGLATTESEDGSPSLPPPPPPSIPPPPSASPPLAIRLSEQFVGMKFGVPNPFYGWSFADYLLQYGATSSDCQNCGDPRYTCTPLCGQIYSMLTASEDGSDSFVINVTDTQTITVTLHRGVDPYAPDASSAFSTEAAMMWSYNATPSGCSPIEHCRTFLFDTLRLNHTGADASASCEYTPQRKESTVTSTHTDTDTDTDTVTAFSPGSWSSPCQNTKKPWSDHDAEAPYKGSHPTSPVSYVHFRNLNDLLQYTIGTLIERADDEEDAVAQRTNQRNGNADTIGYAQCGETVVRNTLAANPDKKEENGQLKWSHNPDKKEENGQLKWSHWVQAQATSWWWGSPGSREDASRSINSRMTTAGIVVIIGALVGLLARIAKLVAIAGYAVSPTIGGGTQAHANSWVSANAGGRMNWWVFWPFG